MLVLAMLSPLRFIHNFVSFIRSVGWILCLCSIWVSFWCVCMQALNMGEEKEREWVCTAKQAYNINIHMKHTLTNRNWIYEWELLQTRWSHSVLQCITTILKYYVWHDHGFSLYCCTGCMYSSNSTFCSIYLTFFQEKRLFSMLWHNFHFACTHFAGRWIVS